MSAAGAGHEARHRCGALAGASRPDIRGLTGLDPFKPYQPRPRSVAGKMTAADAEAVGLRAVAWIVGDATMLSRFTALTGCGADDLRARIQEPAFLGSVLDFVLADERTLLELAEHEGFPPETPALARAILPGGATTE